MRVGLGSRVWHTVRTTTEPSAVPHASIASPRLVAELSAHIEGVRELTSAVLWDVPRRPRKMRCPSVSDLGFRYSGHPFFRLIIPGCSEVTRDKESEDRWTYLRKVTEPRRLPTASKDASTSGAGSRPQWG